MKNAFSVILLALCITLQAQTVKIAAAGSLRFILEEIKIKYSAVHPETEIVLNYGSSGALFQQIMNGADFDIFMAADKLYPDKLKAQGIVSGDVKTYAFGRLVLWSNSVDVSHGLEILTDKSVNRIAVAKPEVAPYGERAVECLKYYNLFEKVKEKIVYADNIAQAAQFAQTGNAEIGFIALSLAISPEMKGSYYVLDTISYKPVEQAMVLMKSRQSNPEAAGFMNFVLGAACRPVFKKYGFILP
jgi:molybdate transport system substrate-binding protein